MDTKNINTEQIILEAAEKIFLDKGYSAAKTLEIAKEAGVNHALLHYYFRTKKNLFNKVFENKILFILSSFDVLFESNSPFLEKIKLCVETHFDLIGKNPKIPMFFFHELISNPERKDSILQELFPKGVRIYEKLNQMVQEEVANGNILQINPLDLMVTIGSLNIMSYISAQIYFGFEKKENSEMLNYLEQRKKNNVAVILKSLRPHDSNLF